jgi:serine/threonine-protein kinase
MGTVHEAVNTWTGRRVAIKLLRQGFARDQEAVERFFREAQNATRVKHPNIVDVLDLGQESDGTLFMVQELLSGETLRQSLVARGKLPTDDARTIILAVMDALIAAHAAGVLHRDIKPENIFLADTGVKLIDFGISKVTDDPDLLALTGRGRTPGTPYYMSPEQLSGVDPIDARSDVWSVGIVLYEMVLGERPFACKSAAELTAMLLREPIPRLRERAPEGDYALADVVDRALIRDPQQRIASMQAMRDALVQKRPVPFATRWLGRRALIAAAALLALVFGMRAVASKRALHRRPSPDAATRASAPAASTSLPASPTPPAVVSASAPSSAIVPREASPRSPDGPPLRPKRPRRTHSPATAGLYEPAVAPPPAAASPPRYPVGTNGAPIVE